MTSGWSVHEAVHLRLPGELQLCYLSMCTATEPDTQKPRNRLIACQENYKLNTLQDGA